jgi:hypothetical protein
MATNLIDHGTDFLYEMQNAGEDLSGPFSVHVPLTAPRNVPRNRIHDVM